MQQPSQHIIDNQPDIIKKFRKCHMRGCFAMGEFSPLISISPDGIQYGHMRFAHWLMCEYHRNNIGLEDLIDKPIGDGRSGWEAIQAAFVRAGKDAPEREYTVLKWELA